MPARLEDTRVLLTGASSGVGYAAAQALAREGARLAIVARSEEALDEVAAQLPGETIVIPADLGEREEAERAVRTAVERLGGLDVLASNAASAAFGHFSEVHPDDFDRTVQVTFLAAVNVIRAALPALRETRGVIAATLSLNSRNPLPGWNSYAASKHALRGFLGTLRIEEREQRTGVRIAMLHPGPIDTPLFVQATSAIGQSPRVPPDSYSAATVGQALCELAIRPRAEVVLGGETKAIDLVYKVSQSLGDTIMMVIDRWYRSGTNDPPQPGSLWQAPVKAQMSGGIPTRQSLLAPFQLGRAMLPSPWTPLRLLRNLAIAATRAAQLGGRLWRPTPSHPVRVGTGERDVGRGESQV